MARRALESKLGIEIKTLSNDLNEDVSDAWSYDFLERFAAESPANAVILKSVKSYLFTNNVRVSPNRISIDAEYMNEKSVRETLGSVPAVLERFRQLTVRANALANTLQVLVRVDQDNGQIDGAEASLKKLETEALRSDQGLTRLADITLGSGSQIFIFKSDTRPHLSTGEETKPDELEKNLAILRNNAPIECARRKVHCF